MEKRIFGFLPDGSCVHEYTLRTAQAEVCILDMGGIVRRLVTEGLDVVGGYDTLEDYLADTGSYQGALIGRVGNRIGRARFVLDGKEFLLAKNDGKNHLHGGNIGFNRRMWNVEEATDDTLALSLLSPDGEEGYPGNLSVNVTYRLRENALCIEYNAVSDADTPVNLTNHSYFNLDGYDGKDIFSHKLQLLADEVTEVDEELIPTGKRRNVEGTVYDFRLMHGIGERLDHTFTGYDTNYILQKGLPMVDVAGYSLPQIATVCYGKRAMEVFTDQPCVQFYTANFLGGKPDFKGGVEKQAHHAFCLETQEEPDAVNHGGGILKAGQKYHHVTVYKFCNG